MSDKNKPMMADIGPLIKWLKREIERPCYHRNVADQAASDVCAAFAYVLERLEDEYANRPRIAREAAKAFNAEANEYDSAGWCDTAEYSRQKKKAALKIANDYGEPE